MFEHIPSFQFEGEGSLEAWIRKIVINDSLMWLRRRSNINMMETVDDNLPQIELSQLSELNVEDICKMVALLPLGYRLVFNLSVIDGYNHQEIAEMMGTTEGTSRSQLFKAKSLLKKILTREGFQYGT